MLTTGPFAWSQRLRYDRARDRVMVRSANVSVPHVLTAFAGSTRVWGQFRAEHPDFRDEDLDACIGFARMANGNSGKDLVAFLELEDDTAGQAGFARCVSEELGRFRQMDLDYNPVRDLADAVGRIAGELADLVGTAACHSPRREVALEPFVRIAAQCQRAAEDLGLLDDGGAGDGCSF